MSLVFIGEVCGGGVEQMKLQLDKPPNGVELVNAGKAEADVELDEEEAIADGDSSNSMRRIGSRPSAATLRWGRCSGVAMVLLSTFAHRGGTMTMGGGGNSE
jgi:hypothetical protein